MYVRRENKNRIHHGNINQLAVVRIKMNLMNVIFFSLENNFSDVRCIAFELDQTFLFEFYIASFGRSANL